AGASPESHRTADEFPDPEDADAFDFPDAMFAAIRRSHDESVSTEAFDPDRPALYFSALRRWANNANRMYRGRFDWIITVADDRGAIPANQPLRIFVVDPESLRPLHREAFVAELSTRD